MKQTIIVTLLLIVFSILAISSMLQKSGTCDEIAHHIPVGVVMMLKGDLKIDTSQPPLARYIMALPIVLFLNPQLPNDPAAWRVEDRSSFGRDFFFKYNNHPKRILFAGRLMIVFVGILCGLVIFLWSKSLFGNRTALFSLFLYVFSPDILAHAQLATTDMVATCCIVLSVYTLWRFVNRQSILNLVMAGITLGCAQLSKYSALILYPIFILLFIFAFSKIKNQKSKSVFLSALGIFAISLIVIWAGYGFRLEPLLKNAMRQEEKIGLINAKANKLPLWNENAKNKLDEQSGSFSVTSTAHPEARRAEGSYKILRRFAPQDERSGKSTENTPTSQLDNFLLNAPIPLGEHLLGVLGVMRHGELGHKTYFLGTWSGRGNIVYFIVAFLIKTPIPVILLLITGLVVVGRRSNSREKYFLLLFPSLYFMSALFSGLQIGVRHLLPIYPFFFIIAARSFYYVRYKICVFIIFALSFWYAASSVCAWPHYLSYFNESIGGANYGWKYLRDSNIDWGQDLPALARYLTSHGDKEVILEYFGEDDPAVYGINFRKFSEKDFIEPSKNIYAVSVNYLENVQWTKKYRPSAKAGYSIFIYDFRDNQA